MENKTKFYHQVHQENTLRRLVYLVNLVVENDLHHLNIVSFGASHRAVTNQSETLPIFDNMEFLSDLWRFLRERKKWWLAPVVVMLLLLGVVVVLGGNSVIAPFIYSIF